MANKEFQLRVNSDEVLKKLAEIDSLYDRIYQKSIRDIPIKTSYNNNPIKEANNEVDALSQKLETLQNTIIGVFSADKILDFANQVINVRGEFQKLEIAFETMLGSKAKADALMSQIVDTAARTPFDLQGVANGAKQLLAYGIASEKVNETLIKLGDIAAGMSLPLSDLVYLYGTTLTQGRVYSRDMLQFMGRGIPLAEELAKQFGVSKDKVSDLVRAGKVGAKEFTQAIDSMANGRFNNLMAKQSASLSGQMSNLGDQIQQAINEIGKSSESFLSDAIAGVSFLVEHYEKLGKALVGLIATYGAFKVATAFASVTKSLGLIDGIRYMGLLAKETKVATAVMTAFNAVTKANPYVLLATAIIGVASAIWAFSDSTDDATKAQEHFNQEQQKLLDLIDERHNKVKSLLAVLRDSNESEYARNKAYKSLIEIYPELFKKMDIEALKTMKQIELEKLLNEEKAKREVQSNEEKLKKMEAVEKRMDRTILTNGGGWLDSKYVEEEFGIEKSFIDYFSGSSDQIKRFRVELEKQRDLVRRNKAEYEEANLSNADKEKRTRQEIERTNKAIEEKSRKLQRMDNKPMPWETAFTKAGVEKEIKELQNKRDRLVNSLNDNKKNDAPASKNYQSIKEEINKLEDNLKSLSTAELKSKEALQIRKNIQELRKQLSAYDVKDNSNSGKNDKSNLDKIVKSRLKDVEEYKDSIKDKLLDSEFEIEEAWINKNKEGYDKAIAIIKFEEKRKALALEREKEEALKKLIEIKQKEYEALHKSDSKGFDSSQFSYKDFSHEQKTYFDNKETANNLQTQEAYLKLLEDYAQQSLSYQKQIEEASKRHHDTIRAIEDNAFISDKEKNYRRLNAEKSYQKELKNIRAKALEEYDLLSLSEGKDSNFIENELKKIMPLFHDISSLSFSELIKAKEAIANIKIPEEAVENLKELGIDMEKIEKNLAKLKSNSQMQIDIKMRDKAIREISTVSASIRNIANSFKSLGGEMENIGSLASAIAETMEAAASFAVAIANGDYVQAGASVVSLIVKAFTSFFESEEKARKKAEEYHKRMISLAYDYNEALIERKALLREQNSILGDNIFAKIKSEGENAHTYLEDLKYKIDKSLKWAMVKTGVRFEDSWFGFKTEAKDVYDFLLNKYPKLIDANGMLNKELARSLLSNAEFAGNSKKVLESTLKMQEKYEESLKNMREGLKSIFGGLGGQIADELTEAFRRGEKGAKAFTDSISKVFEDFTSKIAFDVALSKPLQEVSDEIANLNEKRALGQINDEQLLDRMGDVFSALLSRKSEIEIMHSKILEMGQKIGKDKGIKAFRQQDPRSATSKGIAQASQDSIDALSGLMHASVLIQDKTLKAVEGLELNRFADIQKAQLNQLSLIRALNEKIETNTAQASRIISDIQRQGITIKR